MEELLEVYEVRERLMVSKVLLSHLGARKETRWRGFQENLDHPEKDVEYECYINSVYKHGIVHIMKRPLVRLKNND